MYIKGMNKERTMVVFRNATATRKAIRMLKESETLCLKLEKLGATLMPLQTAQGWTVFCSIPMTVRAADEYELAMFVRRMLDERTPF